MGILERIRGKPLEPPERRGFFFKARESGDFLSEASKGKVFFTDSYFNPDLLMGTDKELAKKIKPYPYNYDLLLEAWKQIAKIQRGVNTRANFAIQSGYRLLGSSSDEKKIIKWEAENHFDVTKIQIVKEMLVFGNSYIFPYGTQMSLKLKHLPIKTMRVIRDDSGELLGYVQIYDNRIIARWKPEEIIHFKWNTIGTEAYGVPELHCLVAGTNLLEKKVEYEMMIPTLIKNYAEPRTFMQCGSLQKPYNNAQMGNLKASIEDKPTGGSLLIPGDCNPIVMNSTSSADYITSLITHVENQINTGINLPQILIEGRSDAQGSMIQMDALERDVKTLQDVLGMGIERGIYTRILDKKDVPEISWNPMNIETYLRTSRTLRQLVGDGKAPSILSIDEAREQIGYKEMEKAEKEEMKSYSQPAPFLMDKKVQDGNNKPGGKEVPMPGVRGLDKNK